MLRLRPYKKSDAEKIFSFLSEGKDFYAMTVAGMDGLPTTLAEFRDFSEKISYADNRFQVVAANDSGVMGYLILTELPEQPRIYRMENIFLNPEGWEYGYGIGTVNLALRYVFDILKGKKVFLKTIKQNEMAFKTYRAAGFNVTGDELTVKIGGREVEIITMESRGEKGFIEVEETVVPEDEMIRDIIDENRLNYALQPIVSVADGEIFGYEALMRADFGANISPETILDYATRKNRMYDIEKLTLFNAMKLYEDNLDILGNKRIFINSIPGYQLTAKDYLIFREKYGKYFDRMTLEVTEHTEFKGQELGVLLERCASDGFTLAIDDYGTGYSNTSSLLSYLPNYLKIDRLLVSDIHAESKKQHFVKSIVEFATANGVKTLAEGVETLAELKSVIELGVDFIQGFYTARPSLDITEDIDEEIKAEIINAVVKDANQDVRKIYTVEKEQELPIMRLALEQYTGILVDRDEFTLVGNTGYSAGMSIKIKDGRKCRMTIRDVFMENTQQLPCIEIGEGSELTLVLEGENRMNRYGIMVPKTGKLIIEGNGDLQIRSQGVASYGIGNIPDAGVGDIKWQGTGSLDILVEADDGIGIGGGEFGEGCGISLTSGMIRIEPACGKAVALGAVRGTASIEASQCKLQLDVKIEKGIGIGSMDGIQDVLIRESNVNILCAGNTIAAIGSIEDTTGSVRIENSELSILANGQQLYLIGAESGDPEISFTDSVINLRGEGSSVLAIGTRDLGSKIRGKVSVCSVRIASGDPLVNGAKTENISFAGGLQTVSVNE